MSWSQAGWAPACEDRRGPPVEVFLAGLIGRPVSRPTWRDVPTCREEASTALPESPQVARRQAGPVGYAISLLWARRQGSAGSSRYVSRRAARNQGEVRKGSSQRAIRASPNEIAWSKGRARLSSSARGEAQPICGSPSTCCRRCAARDVAPSARCCRRAAGDVQAATHNARRAGRPFGRPALRAESFVLPLSVAPQCTVNATESALLETLPAASAELTVTR